MQRLCRPWYPDEKDTTSQQQIINDYKGYLPHLRDRLLFVFFLGGTIGQREEWHSWGTLQILWECMVRWMGKIREGSPAIKPYKKTRVISQQAVLRGLYVNPQQSTQRGGWGYMGSPKVCHFCCMLFCWLPLETSNHAWNIFPKFLPQTNDMLWQEKDQTSRIKKHTLWHIQGNQGSTIYHLYKSTSELTPRIET